MDGQRFDELTRTLAAGASRRAALRILAGGAAAGFLTLVRGSGARADEGGCKRTGKHCRRPDQCCSGVCLADGTCGCASHADCDDRNACTVGLCGPESRQCHQIRISSTCTQCRSNADCPGGNCCHGRCCPGTECQQAATGEPICCRDCGGGASCCDTIIYDPSCEPSPSCDGIGYDISTAECYFGTGACASCPPICNVHPCGYEDRIDPVEGGCGAAGACTPLCTAPVGGVR